VAIIGDLTDLRLPELFSLISLRGMSGQLVLQRREDDAVLEFQDGQLVRVLSSRVSQPLGELLVQRGTLTPSTWPRCWRSRLPAMARPRWAPC